MNPPIHVPATEILAAGRSEPKGAALYQKRHGRWHAWSRADVATASESLAQVLRERGIDSRSLVAVSGDHRPALLLFVIAAAQAGARVVAIRGNIPQAELVSWLQEEPASLVYLGQREQVSTWRAALREAEVTGDIVADFHQPWGQSAAADLIAAADLLSDAAGGRIALPIGKVLWTEEGTEWHDGMEFLLHALSHGVALAFPESRSAAARDRQEIQPYRFGLSPSHHRALARDLATRLPTGGSATAWLARKALGAGSNGSPGIRHRWLLQRMRRPMGLANLRELTVVGSADAAPAPVDSIDLFTALGIAADHAAPRGEPADRSTRSRLAFA